MSIHIVLSFVSYSGCPLSEVPLYNTIPEAVEADLGGLACFRCG